ncbi:MAG: phosphoglycerate kinase [Frankiales bacterium]|nr:phosphoglycerate kinase [Frankiales bacterium]
MELVLVRHALPVRVDATEHGGPADPGLSDVGWQQAVRILEALALDEVTHLYSSPAARALETAEPLVAKLALPLEVDEGLGEFDREHASYVPVEELRAENDPRWHALVKGELLDSGIDPQAFRAGVVQAIEAIAARHPGGRAVLFTHAGVINAYAGHVAGQARVLWFAPAYASLTRVGASRDGRRGLVSLNETGHVRDLLTR